MREEHPITDALLDRLVDGELPPDEERRLLQSLESAPDGWRRCALGFLEAQLWRRELLAMKVGAASPKATGPTKLTDPRASDAANAVSSPNPGWNARRFPALALAASVLFAFAAGWLSPHSWRGDDPIVHQIVEAPGEVSLGDNLVVQSAAAGELLWPEVVDPSNYITLVMTQPDGSVHPVLVPLVEEEDAHRLAGGITEAGFDPSLPPSVRRQLEQSGYEVEHRRRYAPLPLESGQRLILPVEDTQIVPVRAGVY
jgi:hypothetical protein